MNAAALRRHLLDADLRRLVQARGGEIEAAFRAVLDRLAGPERLFTFSKDQKDRIARRAARLMVARAAVSPSVRRALTKGAWRERAAAASELSRGGSAIRSAGSLANAAGDGRRAADLDGRHAARALATAIREIGTPGVVEAQSRLAGDAATALREETAGPHVWEKALSPLLREFAWNASSAGATRHEAALDAVTAAAALTGRARQGNEDDLPFLLGAASNVLLHVEKPLNAANLALRRLAEDAAARNAARQGLWDDLDPDMTRLLGATAAQLAFGKGMPHRREVRSGRMPFDPASLPEAWRERLAPLTAAEAADELSRMAADPRMGEDDRATAETVAEAALAHAGAGHVSFAEALGLESSSPRKGPMRQGRLFRAAPRGGIHARILCRGKNGRLIRCRAAADDRGALVGYLAFDPLSREYGGRPLFAAYGFDGRRQGYAWADEPIRWRAGAPEQGFVSVPETIPV